jgi:hypothetical protein
LTQLNLFSDIEMATWGLYPWFRESGLDLIHPEDLPTVLDHSPYCKLCEVIGADGQYLMIRYGSHQFRGRAEFFTTVTSPAYCIGQSVTTKAPRTLRAGVISDVGWHYQQNAPFYFLDVDGDAISSRYWQDELELA